MKALFKPQTRPMATRALVMVRALARPATALAISLLALGGTWVALAQQASFGNTYIDDGGRVVVFGPHTFTGSIVTSRASNFGSFGFGPNSSWTGASNSAMVDGYATSYGQNIVLPTGANSSSTPVYRPIALQNVTGTVHMAYVASAPPNNTSLANGIGAISSVEHWLNPINGDNGTHQARLTLTWNNISNVSSLIGTDLSQLSLVGFNPTANAGAGAWQIISSRVDVASLNLGASSPTFDGAASTLTTGSISSTAVINLENFTAFTLAGLDQHVYWDGNNTTANNQVDGGAGTWNSDNTNWTTANGNSNNIWPGQGNTAIFQGTGGNVAVNGVQSFGGLTFEVDGYSLQPDTGTGHSLQGVAGQTNTITVNTGQATGQATIGVDIANNSAALDKQGTGVLVLQGNALHTGATVVSAGELRLCSGNANDTAGSLPNSSGIDIQTNATFSFGCDQARDIPQPLTGDGTFNVLAGTPKLSANSSFTGAVNVTSGNGLVLDAPNPNTLDPSSRLTVGQGQFLDLNSTTQTFTSPLAVAGELRMGSGGSLTLGAPSGQSVTHSIHSITGSGTITVGIGATLVLTGAVNNTNVNIVLAGGTLQLGNLNHALGDLSLAANSTLDFSSSGNAQLTVENLNPSLETNGSISANNRFELNVSNWTAGQDRFFAKAVQEAPTRNTANLPPLNQVTLGGNSPTLTFWRSNPNQPDDNELLVANAQYTFWDTVPNNGQIDGGTGVWDSALANWTTSNGTPNGLWAGGVATFQGTAGSVTVEGTQSFSGLTFGTTGYSLVPDGNNTGELALSQDGTITVGTGLNARMGVPISGAQGLTVTGGGRLDFAAVHQYTGITTVTGSTNLRLVSGATANNANLVVDTGASLSGLGSIGGGLTVNGLLSPGAETATETTPGKGGVGAIVVTTDLVLDTNSSVHMDLGNPVLPNQRDEIIVGGRVNVGGALTINAQNGFNTGASYILINTGSPNTIFGAFSSDNLPAIGYKGFIEYDNTNGQVRLSPSARVRVTQTTVGSTDTFGFVLNGLQGGGNVQIDLQTTQTNTPVTSQRFTPVLGQGLRIRQITPSQWPTEPQTLVCQDTNRSISGNSGGNLATVVGNQATLPGSVIVSGADIECTFTNKLNLLKGTVFNDGGAPVAGANTGSPNNGVQDGQEPGTSALLVTLSDCASTTVAQVTTQSGGSFAINIPDGQDQLTPTLCLTAALPPNHIPTAMSVNGTEIADGSTPTTVAGIAFTYTRSSSQVSQQVQFNTPTEGELDLQFGHVPNSTLTPPTSSSSGSPQGFVNYGFRFTAGTGGQLQLQLPDGKPTPSTVTGWQSALYLDSTCQGQFNNAMALVDPATPTTVVQGQSVCVVVRTFVPGTAIDSSTFAQPLQATLQLRATPQPSVSYTSVATTRASTQAVQLRKEVRNRTTNPNPGPNDNWQTSVQAKPGDELEYRITFTNLGAAPVQQVVVRDNVNPFFNWLSAAVEQSPTGMTCAANTPQNPAPQAAGSCTVANTNPSGSPLSGDLVWTWSGTLQPGAQGQVTYRAQLIN